MAPAGNEPFLSGTGGPPKNGNALLRPFVLLGLESECCLVFARSKSNERLRGGPCCFGLGGASRAPGDSAPGAIGSELAEPDAECACECELVFRSWCKESLLGGVDGVPGTMLGNG